MNLVEGGFAGWWKKFSVQALVLIMLVQQFWEALPAVVQQSLGPNTLQWVTTVLALLGVLGRFIKQTQEAQP